MVEVDITHVLISFTILPSLLHPLCLLQNIIVHIPTVVYKRARCGETVTSAGDLFVE